MALRQDASTGQITDDGQPPAEPKKNGAPLLAVKVYSPYKVYFEQNARSVTGQNATGPFSILPHHHDFISLLSPCELVVVAENGREFKIKIAGGVMHVHADAVTVFLDV